MSNTLSREELARRFSELDGKCRTHLQLAGIVLAILVLPATSGYFPDFPRGVVAVNFLLVALIALHVMGVGWDADEATLRRLTRFHNIGRRLTAAGVTFLAAVPPIVQVLVARV